MENQEYKERFKKLDDLIYSKTDAFEIAKLLGFELKSESSGSFVCKLHDEKHPSFVAKKGSRTWSCLSNCGTGNIYQLWGKVKKISEIQAVKEIAKVYGISDDELEFLDSDKNKEILGYLKPLSERHQNYLINRGWDLETIKDFELYSYGDNIVFTLYQDGFLKGFKFKNVVDKKKQYFRGNDTECKCYPNNSFLDTEILYIVAGEWDCGYLHQELKQIDSTQDLSQFKAITFSTGEKSLPSNILSQLSKVNAPNLKEIRIVYDNDISGIEGSKIIANKLSPLNIPIYIYQFPSDKKKGYDTSDYFNDGYTIQDFLNLQRYRYNEKIEEKTEQSDYELEKLLLNSILFNDSFYSEIQEMRITVTDFKDYKTQEIYKVIMESKETIGYCDYNLLNDKVTDSLLKEFLKELYETRYIITFEELQETVDLIHTSSYKRLLKLSVNKFDKLSKKNLPLNQLHNEFDKICQEHVLTMAKREQGSTLTKCIDDWRESFNKPAEIAFIPTPFKYLNDKIAGGLPIGRISLLTAPVSAGKTTVSTMFLLEAIRLNFKSIVYLLESDKEETTQNILSSRTLIENTCFRTKTFPTHNRLDDIYRTGKSKSDDNLTLVEAQAMSIDDIINDIKFKVKKDNSIKLVVLDQINSLSVEGNLTRSEFLSRCVVKLKDLALTCKIALLVNCQLTRSASKNNKSSGANIELEDIGETSNLEKLAHLVMTVVPRDEFSTIIKLPKNRSGKRGDFCTIYPQLEYSRFTETPTNFKSDKYEGEV